MKLLTVCLLVLPFSSFINAFKYSKVFGRFLKCNHDQTLNLDVSEIMVHFYDHVNKRAKQFPINNAIHEILSTPQLNKSSKFYVYIGGFTSRIDDKSTPKVIEAFKATQNGYLLVFDHSPYTCSKSICTNLYDYGISVTYVHYIGKKVAEVLVALKNGNISPKNIHCIGHSLGGQMLGHVGTIFYNHTTEKIAKMTALDPAGPCFANNKIELQIRKGVAEYVEVYHCNAKELGSHSVLADVDFYVNNGKTQPGCKKWMLFMTDKCSHSKCIDVWAASVLNPKLFKAYQCKDYEMFKSNKCSKNNITDAGFGNPGSAQGVYYFSTKDIVF